MECKNCFHFEQGYYYRRGDMPDSPHGFCNKGATTIERATLIRETAQCRYDPPRFMRRETP